MLNEIFLAVVQAATEFLPISSSGHLALFSNLISKPNLFFFTALHLASLAAVIIFTRKEIADLLTFRKQYRKMWLYLIVATLPAASFGFLGRHIIKNAFSSFLFIGIAFIFTGLILYSTKFSKKRLELNAKNSLVIGLFQALALFPGISRSGMTISSALFLGVDREKAVKFSFLLFMPLSALAFVLEAREGFYLSLSLLVSFLLCFVLSLVFINLLFLIVKKEKFWIFSLYCFLAGVVSLFLYFS